MKKADREEAIRVLQLKVQDVEVAIDRLEHARKSEIGEILDEVDDEIDTLKSDVADFRREVSS